MAGNKCRHCFKLIETARGMTRHLTSCRGKKTVEQMQRRKALKARQTSRNPSSLLTGQASSESAEPDAPLMTPSDVIMSTEHPAPAEPITGLTDNQFNAEGINDIVDVESADDFRRASSTTTDVDDAENQLLQGDTIDSDPTQGVQDATFVDNLFKGKPLAIVIPPARVSTASSVYTRTYEEETGLPAGKPVKANEPMANALPLTDSDPFHPFKDELEYGLGQFFIERELSKGDINAFLLSPFLKSVTSKLSFRNADQFFARLDESSQAWQKDSWRETKLIVPSTAQGVKASSHSLLYCNVEEVIRQLMGHIPFKDNLAYAPVHHYNAGHVKVYTEMHTGDWWWETQRKLPLGATVVPLLLASDKTALTILQGDKSMWPVYLSIGNLDHGSRRSQRLNGIRLVGLLPNVTGVDVITKTQIYHSAMAFIFKSKLTCSCEYRTAGHGMIVVKLDSSRVWRENGHADECTDYAAIEVLAVKGMYVRCADDKIRKCYPVLAGIMADYEEQVMIAGVKSGHHCTICEVPPNERQNLTKRWPERTHESMQLRIERQRALLSAKPYHAQPANEKEVWVRDVHNFAWKHRHVNIHGIMMMDILHQLHKGVVDNLIEWVKSLVNQIWAKKRRPKGLDGSLLLRDAGGEQLLDHRFDQVPEYPGLKRFGKFTSMKQCTGEQQKSIARQLVSVIAPLLTKKAPASVLFARALMDFLNLAYYRSHDETTLQYMEDALYRIDKLKCVFSRFRPTTAGVAAGHFNYPKFHVMSHYTAFIRRFGTLDGYDTSYSEAAHKYLVKAPYQRTNKRDGFEKQVLEVSNRRLTMLSMNSVLSHSKDKSSRNQMDIDKRLDAKVNTPARELPKAKLAALGWTSGGTAQITAQHAPKLMYVDSLTATEFASALGDIGSQFLDALAVFVRESRKEEAVDTVTNGRSILLKHSNLREQDSAWIRDFEIKIHPSLTTYKFGGKNAVDPNQLDSEIMRCSPDWQNTGCWRRDHVWVQDVEDLGQHGELGGKRVARLLAIVTVYDRDVRRKQSVAPGELVTSISAAYCGAFVEVLRPRSKLPHEIHGMYEVELDDDPLVSEPNARRPRTIGNRRFYNLNNILRGAHVVPAFLEENEGLADAGRTGRKKKIYYINNYIDWDQYSTLYDPDFLKKGKRLADKHAAQVMAAMEEEDDSAEEDDRVEEDD